MFFQTALPFSGGYHLERGVMPLHDVVGINWKGRNYWKSRLMCPYMGSGVYVEWLYVSYRTLHDYQLLVEGESQSIILLNIYIFMCFKSQQREKLLWQKIQTKIIWKLFIKAIKLYC